MAETGMIRFMNNAQLDAAEKKDSATQTSSEPAPVLIGLASHVQRCWQEVKTAKDYILPRLLAAQLARAGKYDAATLAQIREFGGSEEYARITANKCRVAEAWIRDVYLGQTEKPWTLAPTPKPEMTEDSVTKVRQQVASEFAAAYAATGVTPPDQVMRSRAAELSQAEQSRLIEVARTASAGMEQEIEDQLVQGGWHDAMGEFIGDLVTFPAAHFKGPVLRKKKTLQWMNNGGAWAPSAQEAVTPEYYRIDPFRAFPSPGSTSPQDGYFIELISLSRGELYALIGIDGYDEKAIREVLEEHGKGGLTDWTTRYALDAQSAATGEQPKPTGSANVTIDALEYHGPVQGRQLVEWGMPIAEIADPDEEYEACVWMIGRWVLKAQLNYDPLGRRPIRKTSYEEIPGSYWGFGLVDILADTQGVANAGLRAMVNNMAFCLTGDTVVYRHQASNAKKPRKHRDQVLAEVTIHQLWEQSKKHNSGLRRNFLRSLNERTGEFYGNRVVNVFDNGIQPVYEMVTVSGYKVKATAAHRFMADTGEYVHLRDLRVGDLVAVNGTSKSPMRECMDCGKSIVKVVAKRCKSCAAKVSTWNIKQAEDALTNTSANEGTARGRKLVQAQKKEACEKCGEREYRLQVHHVDKDPMNCNPDNLMTLCEPCHKQWHMRHDNYGDPFKHTYVDFDQVVSITYVGEEQVFDLEMTAPDHNFVANGFVSHNCSGPQVGVNVDRLPPGEDLTKMHPLKIWQFNESQVGSNTKAIEFFQPETNSSELFGVIEKMYQLADDFSLIPRWLSSGSGGERTASGMSMKMDAANKGLKGVVSNIDMKIVSPVIEATFNYNMLFNPDQSIKGDSKVVARGAVSLMQLETLQIRRNEFLVATANPLDSQIVGLEGRAEILRETAKGLQMDVNRVIPPRGSLQGQTPATQEGNQQQATPTQGSGQQLGNGAEVTDNFSKTAMTPA